MFNSVRDGMNLSCHVVCRVADVQLSLFVWSHWHNVKAPISPFIFHLPTLFSSVQYMPEAAQGVPQVQTSELLHKDFRDYDGPARVLHGE